jgi:hypothetical protein
MYPWHGNKSMTLVVATSMGGRRQCCWALKTERTIFVVTMRGRLSSNNLVYLLGASAFFFAKEEELRAKTLH